MTLACPTVRTEVRKDVGVTVVAVARISFVSPTVFACDIPEVCEVRDFNVH